MPHFTHHLFCCTNRREPGKDSCAARGSEELRDYLKQRIKALGLPDTRVNAAGCLGQCAKGPTIVIYPEGTWYSCKTKADANRIIEEHLIGGNVVEGLLMG